MSGNANQGQHSQHNQQHENSYPKQRGRGRGGRGGGNPHRGGGHNANVNYYQDQGYDYGYGDELDHRSGGYGRGGGYQSAQGGHRQRDAHDHPEWDTPSQKPGVANHNNESGSQNAKGGWQDFKGKGVPGQGPNQKHNKQGGGPGAKQA